MVDCPKAGHTYGHGVRAGQREVGKQNGQRHTHTLKMKVDGCHNIQPLISDELLIDLY